MKLRNILKILILAFAIFLLNGCKKEEVSFNVTQDGYFFIYEGKGITNETSFVNGTRLIAKVKEDLIPNNKMVDKIFINGVSHNYEYQYDILVDKNIDLKVSFKDIPVGSSKVTFQGLEVEVLNKQPGDVYVNGTELTIKAPMYHIFNYITINDIKVIVESDHYVLEVSETTNVVILEEGLEKTHTQVFIFLPSEKHVTIVEDPVGDKYHRIGSTITLQAPEQFSFTGEITIGNQVYTINGDRFTVIVTNDMEIRLFNRNFALNNFKVEIDSEDLVIDAERILPLYAYGSIVNVKAIGNGGFDIIDTITINGEVIKVNSARYEIEIQGDTQISATFKPYDGTPEEINASTTDPVQLLKSERVYSPSLNVYSFIVRNSEYDYLVFQKDGAFKVRIDSNLETKYYLYTVKYSVEEIKIYQNGFGFINRNELVYVGSENEFSLQLEVKAILLDLEDINSTNAVSLSLRSDQIDNLEFTLEENGLDVTNEYLESKSLKFSPEAIGKSFDLIISTEDGVQITQLIKVIKGTNINSASAILENINLSDVLILQTNLHLNTNLSVSTLNELIGNYHTITFDKEALEPETKPKENELGEVNLKPNSLIVLENNTVTIKDVILRSRLNDKIVVFSNQSKLTLDNVVIEGGLVGVLAVDSNLVINSSKFQHIKDSNLIVVNKSDLSFESNTTINSSVLSKTDSASILIVDLDSVYNTNPILTLTNNTYKNIKTDPNIEPEILDKLKEVNPEFVIEDPLQYNLVFIIDGGILYYKYTDEPFEFKDTPNATFN